MGKTRKESRQFNISVEGINCERLYFEHLAKLINASDASYNMKSNCKKVSPLDFAKRNSYLPADKCGKNKIPYIHIQDIEDYYDEKQLTKFKKLIDDMREAENEYGLIYKLGYSNYTFELWMLLHVKNMNYAVSNRYAYLNPINDAFHQNFKDLKEFKKEDNFKKILDDYVNLNSVFLAIERAEKIVESNCASTKTKENYKGIEFYHDNPDINVHDIIKLIFEVCGVKRIIEFNKSK